jgi:hypothetical protein
MIGSRALGVCNFFFFFCTQHFLAPLSNCESRLVQMCSYLLRRSLNCTRVFRFFSVYAFLRAFGVSFFVPFFDLDFLVWFF